MKDNPCLTLQTPEVIRVYGFFNKYEPILDEYKFTANLVYNDYETSLPTVYKPSKIIV